MEDTQLHCRQGEYENESVVKQEGSRKYREPGRRRKQEVQRLILTVYMYMCAWFPWQHIVVDATVIIP